MEEKNIVLSQEMKEKLRGLIGFSKDPYFLYVPKAYRNLDNNIPKELWATFKLKGKTGIDIALSEDTAGYMQKDTNTIVMTAGANRIQLLKKHISGWNNFYDVNGDKIDYKLDTSGLLSDECIKRLPAKLQIELNEAINEKSTLSEEELLGLEF